MYFLLVPILIVLLIFLFRRGGLDGFYVGGREFIKQAGLSQLMFCFKSDTVYIIMATDDTLVINDMYKYRILGNTFELLETSDSKTLNDALPKKMSIKLSLSGQKIELYTADTVYAVLYKELEMSEQK
jgi:hypothetical protein